MGIRCSSRMVPTIHLLRGPSIICTYHSVRTPIPRGVHVFTLIRSTVQTALVDCRRFEREVRRSAGWDVEKTVTAIWTSTARSDSSACSYIQRTSRKDAKAQREDVKKWGRYKDSQTSIRLRGLL